MAFTRADRATLALLLRTHSVKTGEFRLASGQTSSVYVDVKKTSLLGQGAELVGRGLWSLVHAHSPDAKGVGGLTLGADPLVTAIAIAAHQDGASFDSIIVRKEAKSHGTRQYLEMPDTFAPDDAIIAVDDVITTAGSTLTAIERLREADFVVEHAICVVDREQGGAQALAEAGVTLHSLFKLSELVDGI